MEKLPTEIFAAYLGVSCHEGRFMHEINRNVSWSYEYSDDSFLGKLHELGEWNDAEYFKLDEELYRLAAEHSGKKNLPRDLTWRMFAIFSHVMLSIGCHLDGEDGYKIENLSGDQLYVRRERFQFVFEGFFSGNMPKREIFDYQKT